MCTVNIYSRGNRMKFQEEVQTYIKLTFKRIILYCRCKARYLFNLLRLINWMIFGLNTAMLLIILGTMLSYRMPLIDRFAGNLNLPVIYELHGNIQINSNIINGNASIHVEGISIEIGGYSCNTNKDGEYQIRFVSREHENIPVIIKLHSKISDTKALVERISFEGTDVTKEEDFLLDIK